MTFQDVMLSIQKLSEYLRSKAKVVVLTGAGISTDSGIPDFRSENGVYSKWDSQKVFDIRYFMENPGYFYEYAKSELFSIKYKQPNDSHLLLYELQKRGEIESLITQNIDLLHQKAGNTDVIELHGSISRSRCLKCRKIFEVDEMIKILEKSQIAFCDKCGGLIKPEIVFFGENLPQKAIEEAFAKSADCDAFLAIGTSLAVYPAASLPVEAKRNGAEIFVVSKGDTGADYYADYKLDMELKEFTRMLKDNL